LGALFFNESTLDVTLFLFVNFNVKIVALFQEVTPATLLPVFSEFRLGIPLVVWSRNTMVQQSNRRKVILLRPGQWLSLNKVRFFVIVIQTLVFLLVQLIHLLQPLPSLCKQVTHPQFGTPPYFLCKFHLLYFMFRTLSNRFTTLISQQPFRHQHWLLE
jgi:hypothetical protein